MSGAKVNSGLFEVGRITRAHGIRGEVCVDYNADALGLLTGSVFLRGSAPEGRTTLKEYKVRGTRLHKGRPLLFLQGVEDRNAAELLRNFMVLIPEERLPELSPNEIYLRDLPGLEIFVNEAGGKKHLGLLAEVADVAGQEIWTIHSPEGKEILFPATEEFVLEINLDQNYALLDPPPGLIELYLG